MMFFPKNKQKLADLGIARVQLFCQVNGLKIPSIEIIPKEGWYVNACAYYRKDSIKICLEECQTPCPDANSRNWTWPGSTIDREPYGVLCHELGHHCDLHTGNPSGPYYSDYSLKIQHESGEEAISGYNTGPEEWFAEMFRVLVTNPDLLRLTRPKTYALLIKKWTPVETQNWLDAMGDNVPERVVKANRNKFVKKVKE